MPQRKIIHIDMDAFFAAVEIRDNPSLKDLPIAVGGSPQERGVISTANYHARRYGVHSALSSWKALQLCPNLILLPCNFSKYKKESQAIQEIFHRFTDNIETLSLDEAFLDVTGNTHFNGSASLIAKEIRRMIFTERNLTASAGIAPNKFLAKVSSDWNKPNGQFTITPEEISDFMKKLPIEYLYGVGEVTSFKMHQLHIHNCHDLQKWDLHQLEAEFGSRAFNLYQMARGIDEREVEREWVRKSLGIEETYPNDLKTLDECLAKVPELFNRYLERYRRIQHIYYTTKLHAKVKFADFSATSVECSFYTRPELNSFKALVKIAWNRKHAPVRLLGLGTSLTTNPDPQLTFW